MSLKFYLLTGMGLSLIISPFIILFPQTDRGFCKFCFLLGINFLSFVMATIGGRLKTFPGKQED